jgi:hypothetical protein
MSAIAGMPATLELELEILEERGGNPADVLEAHNLARRREEQERRTRVYIRVWRTTDVVLKNGKFVEVTVRKWRVAGTWLEILREQQDALDDADDYIRAPDLKGLRLLWGVPDAVVGSIPDLEEHIERMEEDNQRWRNLQSIRRRRYGEDDRDVYTHELDAARTRLRAARAQVEAALDRWDRRRHAVAAFCRTL